MAHQLTQAEVTAMLQNMTNIANALGGPRPAREQSIVKVQNFYGENEDPYEWFDEFMKAVEANNWPDGARRYHLAAAHLKGAAKQWYDEQLAAVTFGNAFANAFNGNNPGNFEHEFKSHFASPTMQAIW